MKTRFATSEDAAVCNKFYNSIYSRDRSVKQWKWEFVEPNSSDTLPYVMAIESGDLVGTQAYIPVRFIDEFGIFLTAKSEETLVSAEMRGKNILNTMYDSLFAYANERDIKSFWGFTPADKAFLKLGFEIPYKTRILVSTLSAYGLFRLASETGTLKRRLSLTLAGFSLSLWRLARRIGGRPRLKAKESLVTMSNAHLFTLDYSKRFVASWGGTTILRDADYMQWRIFDNPHTVSSVLGIIVDGRLSAHIVFSIDNNCVGRIIDVMATHTNGRADEERVSHILLAEAVRRLQAQGAEVIVGMTVNNHPFDALIRKISARLGFANLNRGSSVVFHTNFGNTKRGSSHDDFTNWFVTQIFTEGQLG